MLGFPIRKSSDLSSVDSSPRLIAASYVLHRLLVPRHPPCALHNLATKMLASTVQFSRYGRTQPTPPRLPAHSRRFATRVGPIEDIKLSSDPSGPNSVPTIPNCLMLPVPAAHPHKEDETTQQRASAVLDTTTHIENRTSQCSTHELHHRTDACEMGLNPQ